MNLDERCSAGLFVRRVGGLRVWGLGLRVYWLGGWNLGVGVGVRGAQGVCFLEGRRDGTGFARIQTHFVEEYTFGL